MAQSAYLSLSCIPLPTFIEGGHAELHSKGRRVSQVHLQYFMFVFVRKGTLIMSQDGRETKVEQDRLFILVPGEHKYAWWAASETVEIDWIYFYVVGDWTVQNGPTPVKNALKSMMVHPNVPVQTLFLRQYQPVRDPERIRSLMDELIPKGTSCESQHFFDSQVLFMRLLDSLRAQDNAQNEMIQLSVELQEYLKSHYQSKITGKKLSEVFGRPANYLVRAFQQTVGMTPTDFLTQYRMEEAGRQLLNTGLSIADIATEVGFQNIYYFSTSFKKYTGISPSKYRQENGDFA